MTADSPVTYTWEDLPHLMTLSCYTCPEPMVSPPRDMVYRLTITDGNGCSATDTVHMLVDRMRQIYFPTGFTPDGDGRNDVFMPYSNERVTAVRTMRVYDRWGELVHRADDFLPNQPEHGWDGTFRGQPAHDGIYTWWAEVAYWDGTTEMLRGDVMLMR